jgi:hypothetical protein
VRPKTSSASCWRGLSVVDEDGCSFDFTEKPRYLRIIRWDDAETLTHHEDALAVIRAAKLDPVFDSAVALAEYWEGCDSVDLTALRKLLDANSAAVKGATDV